MRRILTTLASLSFALAAPLPAQADGGVTVKLPDAGQISAAASPKFLTQLVMANVAGSNCPGYALSDGEWALITGTADRVADALGIGNSAYDDNYYGPAFAALDQPGTCEAEGPKIAPLIQKLRSMGGGTDAIG